MTARFRLDQAQLALAVGTDRLLVLTDVPGLPGCPRPSAPSPTITPAQQGQAVLNS